MAHNNDKHEQKQQALLDELESIKVLLNDAPEDCDIPVLDTVVANEEEQKTAEKQLDTDDQPNNDHQQEAIPTIDLTALEDIDDNCKIDDSGIYTEPSHLSYAEQSDREQSPIRTAQQTATASKQKPEAQENPFLPEHIRKRLNSIAALPGYEEMLLTAATLNASTNTLPTPGLSEEQEQLVHELVSDFLPIIEARLREKLKALVLKEDKHQ